MKPYELPNGEKLEFPDEMSDEQIESTLRRHYPEQFKPKWENVFKEALKQRNAPMEYFEEVQKARKTPEGMALELPLFLAAPELEIPGLSRLLGTLLPKAGKYITSGIQTAIPQAGLAAGSAALSDEEVGKPAIQTAAMTAPFGALSQAISSGSPKTRLAARLAGMLGAGTVGYEGAKALGANPFTAATSGLGTALVPGALWKAIKPSSKIEKNVINRWYENVFPEKDIPKIEEAYEKSYASGAKVPEDIFGLKENKIFQEAEKKMLNEPVYEENLKGIPENSIQYLDYVKRKLYGLEKANLKEGGDLASGYRKVRQELSKELGELSPEYKLANDLFERQAARKNIEEKFFNNREVTGENFSKYLENKKNYKELQKHLRNVPEAAQQVKVMKEIFKKLEDIKPPDDLKKYNIFNDVLKTYKYDKAMTELASNPAWKGQLDDLIKISKKEEFFAKFIDILAKTGAKKVASNDSQASP